MGPAAICLELSRKLDGHHQVIYVLSLYRYLLGSDRVEPIAPVIVKDVDEYKLNAFIAH